MATVGDALSGLAQQQIKLDKLETLLGTGKAPAGATPTSALSHAPVPPTGASVANDGLEAEQLQARAPAEGNNASGKKPAQGAAPASPSVQTRLSPDAVLLGRLLSQSEQLPTTVLPRQPIDISSMPPPQAARALAHSLAASGLFYEAHLREWFAGERPLAALKAEPHNRLTANLARATAAAPPGQASNAAPTNAPTTAANAAGSSQAPTITPLPEALAPVVREQLDVLETGRVFWQGEVWPQQSAQLVFAQDEPHSAESEEDSEAAESAAATPWRTTLHIDLPRLGEIEVDVRLDDAGVAVNLRAAQHALQALRTDQSAFAAALEDAGIALRIVDMQRADAT